MVRISKLMLLGLLTAMAMMAMSRIAPAAEDQNAARLQKATTVLNEIMSTPDNSIPQDLFDKAQCVAVVPALKTAALGVGGKYGKGYLSCRKANGTGWSAPGAIRIEGGSFGLQLGGSATDIVMLVMNKSGADKLLASKFTMGAEGEVAAGPVGRTSSAETDVAMRAEILSWSRSKGAFAGISLQGSTLRDDTDDNKALYGRPMTNREIVTGNVAVPADAKGFIGELNKISPREHK